MASPHVAGAAAVLQQRHPDVDARRDQVGARARPATRCTTAARSRSIRCAKAEAGSIFRARTSRSCSLSRPRSRSASLRPGSAGVTPRRTVGCGRWRRNVERVSVSPAQGAPVAPASGRRSRGLLLFVRSCRAARASARWRASSSFHAAPLDAGFRSGCGSSAQSCGSSRSTLLSRPGTYSASTARGAARVTSYRYPTFPPATRRSPSDSPDASTSSAFASPGRSRTSASRVIARDRGVSVEPRIVRSGDENRLAGYTALPFDQNPYRASYGRAPARRRRRPPRSRSVRRGLRHAVTRTRRRLSLPLLARRREPADGAPAGRAQRVLRAGRRRQPLGS